MAWVRGDHEGALWSLSNEASAAALEAALRHCLAALKKAGLAGIAFVPLKYQMEEEAIMERAWYTTEMAIGLHEDWAAGWRARESEELRGISGRVLPWGVAW